MTPSAGGGGVMDVLGGGGGGESKQQLHNSCTVAQQLHNSCNSCTTVATVAQQLNNSSTVSSVPVGWKSQNRKNILATLFTRMEETN